MKYFKLAILSSVLIVAITVVVKVATSDLPVLLLVPDNAPTQRQQKSAELYKELCERLDMLYAEERAHPDRGKELEERRGELVREYDRLVRELDNVTTYQGDKTAPPKTP